MNQKLKIKLYDTNFSHHNPGSSISSFPGHDVFPKYIEWIRDPNFESDIAFFSDNCLNEVDKDNSKFKFGWIIEPRCLVPSVYEQISNPELYKKFDKILTHDEELLKLEPERFVPCPLFGAWISKEDSKIYPKSKNVCIIASHKNQLFGHTLRHEIINKLRQKYFIDVFGNGYNSFDKASNILKDYRFVICVENVKNGHWITEKLTTPILCGCIPIYYGSPNVDEYFSKIVTFDNVEELDEILSVLNKDYYESDSNNLEINDNYNEAIKCRVLEDWIYKEILVDYLEKH